MNSYYKQAIGSILAGKVFDCIRLIDLEGNEVYHEYNEATALFSVPVVNEELRKNLYHRCIVLDTVFYSIEQTREMLLLFVVAPLCVKRQRLVMECITNISRRMALDYRPKKSMATLDHAYALSVTDELTGLYNRRYINYMLPVHITACIKRQEPLTIIFTDLDFFKEINDFYGHLAGDSLLRDFALQLKENLRKNIDWVARYGGDEFLLCLMNTGAERAKAVAEAIRKSIEEKVFSYHAYTIKATCSLGIYTVDPLQEIPTLEFVLRSADRRLYEAKKTGRNRIR